MVFIGFFQIKLKFCEGILFKIIPLERQERISHFQIH